MAQTYITDRGIISPDTSEVQSEVQGEFRTALGQDLNLAHSTPQGQLISAEVTARSNVIRACALLANQINPTQSDGVFLRSIGELMGIDDTKAVRSVVLDCVVTGAPNSLFPNGSIATNVQGAQFVSINDIMLDEDGRGVVTFQAVSAGAIPVGVNGLTPAQPVAGWSNVENLNVAIEGTARLTDYQYRIYRLDALAAQSVNQTRSIVSRLRQLPGVRSVLVRENDEAYVRVIDGVAMEKNSVWVCVNDDGGVSEQIAATLLECKAPGCKWSVSTNGAGNPVTVNQVDPVSGQTYPIKFTRSLPKAVWVRAFVSSNNSMSNLSTASTDAILAYANGEVDNQPGFVVGAQLSPAQIAGALFTQIPGIYVRQVEVSFDGSSWSQTALEVKAWERPTLPRGNILITVES